MDKYLIKLPKSNGPIIADTNFQLKRGHSLPVTKKEESSDTSEDLDISTLNQNFFNETLVIESVIPQMKRSHTVPTTKVEKLEKSALQSTELIENLMEPVLGGMKWLGVTPKLIIDLENTFNSMKAISSDENLDNSNCRLVIAQGSVVEFGSHGLNINMAIVNAANEGCQGGGGVDGAITEAGLNYALKGILLILMKIIFFRRERTEKAQV